MRWIPDRPDTISVRHTGAVRSRGGVVRARLKVAAASPRARVVRLRPRLRVVARTSGPPLAGGGIVIPLHARRASRDVPRSPEGVWFIVTLTAMLAFVVVWRFLH